MITRTRITTITCAVVGTLAIAACTGPDDGGTDATGDSSPQTISVMTEPPSMTTDVITALATEYSAENTQFAGVRHEAIPYAQFFATLNVKLVGDEAPEVVTMHPSFIDDYMDSGRLVDFKPIIDRDWPDFDLTDFNEGALSLYSRPAGCSWSEGADVPCENLYGLPFVTTYSVLYYNTEAFRASGLPTPTEMLESGTWTWDNMRAALKTIVDDGATVSGMAENSFQLFTNTGWQVMPPFWEPFGAGPWSEDQKTCTFNSEETIAATQAVWDMVFVDQTMPGPGVPVNNSSFAAGELAIVPGSATSGIVKPDFEYGAVPWPAGPEGARPFAETKAWVVLKDSPQPDLGAAFAIYLSTKDTASSVVSTWQVPRQSIFESEVFSQGTLASNMMSPELWREVIVPEANATEQWRRTYGIANFGQILSTSLPIFNTIWDPEADIPAIMDKVCEVVQPLLPD